MNESQLIDFLWKHGYFWKFDSGKNVTQSDLGTLKLTDRCVISAVMAWQASDQNFDILSAVVHSRAIIPDGDVGPVTRTMLDVPRCPMPDFAPPAGASFHYDDPQLQAAVESMQAANLLGSGGWPSCNPKRPGVHSVRVGLNTKRAPANWRANKDKILAACIQCAGESGLAVEFILDDPNADVELNVEFENIPGSVIGYNYFPQPNTCNQTVQGRLDIGYDPSDYRLHANLDTHEFLGHGAGLQHTRGGIMNASILLVWPLSWKGDPGWPQFKSRYGGESVLEPTDPPPPPPPGGEYNGVFTIGPKLYKIRVFE